MSTSPLASVPVPTIEQLTANAARLLQQALVQASQAGAGAAGGELSATDLALARSNINALAFVQGAGLHGAYRYLRDTIARQAVPVWSTGAFLDGWLADTYGMARKGAALAAGQADGSGDAGAVVPAGTLLQLGDGRQYQVTTATTVGTDGLVTVPVVARAAGLAGNEGAGATLTLVASLSGVDAAFVVGTDGLTGGVDAESDTDAAYRLAQRLAHEPMGGTPADYARWALAVPGITRAWGIRNIAGPTSAGVVIMADGNADGLATEVQRQAVEDYIRDPMRGPPDELFVIVPTLVPVNITVHVQPNTGAIQSGVAAALADLFVREAVPGGQIPQSHVVEAISGVVGEYNHTISSPAIVSGGVFSAGAVDHILSLGSLTFT